MNKPKTMFVFRNLLVAAIDEQGQQIPELQRPLLCLLAEHAEKCGYDLDGVAVETVDAVWRIFLTEEGQWNQEIINRKKDL